jgi:DUF971 family protein
MDAPAEIRLSADKRTLKLVDAQGVEHQLAAEYVRVESPSAEVQGHGPAQARLISGKAEITITGLEPVGSYALRIVFADGHQTGLYTWEYLVQLVAEYPTRWAAYEAALSAHGLSRTVAAPPVLRHKLGV